MKKTNKNWALISFMLITAIALINIIINVDWKRPETTMALPYSTQQMVFFAAATQSAPATAVDKKGNFIIVWESDDNGDKDIYYRRFDYKGEATDTNAVRANFTTSGSQTAPKVAMDSEGNFVIAWAGNGTGDSSGIFMQVFGKNGIPIDEEVRVNSVTTGTQEQPSISIDYDGGTPSSGNNERMAIAWTDNDATYGKDVYYQLFDIDFSVSSDATDFVNTNRLVNSYRTNDQQHPSVAMNEFGEFIIFWDGEGVHQTNTFEQQIWMQPYGADGTDVHASSLRGSYVLANSEGITWAQKPSAMADKSTDANNKGNYVVTYEGGPDEASPEIFARRINRGNLSGCPINVVEMQVNTETTGIQDSPSIAIDETGDFTIVWHDNARFAGNIYGQSYRHTGARVGIEFVVNPNNDSPSADQNSPAIAMTPDGFFKVAYNDNSTNPGIRFQQYVSNLFHASIINQDQTIHTAREQLANIADTDNQENIKTSMSPNGNRIVVWNNGPGPIYFTLWDNQYEIPVLQNQNVSGNCGNCTTPDVSFYKDIQGNDVGRFIIVFAGNPACKAPSEGSGNEDIWYREYLPNGNPADSYCHIVNTNAGTYDSQSHPLVDTGYYNNDGSTPEDIFAVEYKNIAKESGGTITGITAESAFHYMDNGSSAFSRNTLKNCGTTDSPATICAGGSITMLPTGASSSNILYTWIGKGGNSKTEIGAYEVIDGTLYSTFTVSDTSTVNYDYPDATFLSNGQYVITYTKYNSDDSSAQVMGKRYPWSENPAAIDEEFAIGQPEYTPEVTFNAASAVASNTTTGDFIAVWADFPSTQEENNIYGRYYQYTSQDSGGLTPYGPSFRINSTKNENQSLPDVSMNMIGGVITAWEGNHENYPGQTGTGDDNAGAVVQFLYDPLYDEPPICYSPEFTQEIMTGGRTLLIPESIVFPGMTINPVRGASSEVSIRNNTIATPTPPQYIEIGDLQGDSTPYNITVNISNFIHNDSVHEIPVTNLYIRNCDASAMDDPSCVDTIEGYSQELTLDPATFDPNTADGYVRFNSPTQQMTIANGTGEHIGKWRIYPKIKLTLPPAPPVTIPGQYRSTITFTLQ